MAIEVGDAIMRFFGDSTQLDQAFNQISADSSAKLGPVKEDIREIGSNWDLSAEKAVVAGEEMQEAAQKTEFSMMEAKGSIALVGEEIGVRLPRHVRGFVAELPGIGPALQAAFAPIAILFMAEALVSLTNKATDFIAKMFIFTEAMQKMDEEAKANNKILLDNEARYDSAKTKLEDLGKTAIELGQDKLKDLNEKIEANAKAFYNAEQTMGAYRLGLDGITKEQAEAATRSLDVLKTAGKALQEERDLQMIENQKAEEADYVKRLNATIQFNTAIKKARLGLGYEEAKELLEQKKDSSNELEALDKSHLEQEYEIEKSALQQRLNLAKQFNNVDETKKIQNEIEVLSITHQTKMLEEEKKYAIDWIAINVSIQNAASSMKFPELPTINSGLLSMTDAAKVLGVTLSTDLTANVNKAKDALKVLDMERKAGIISAQDFAKAELAVVQAEIKVALATGQNTLALQRQEKELKAQIPTIDTVKIRYQGLQQGIVKVDSAFNQFVSGMVTGSETVGQAARKMTQEMLSALASYAEKKGAASLAQGFSDLGDPLTAGLATAAFTGAAEWFALAGAASAGSAFAGGGSSSGGHGSSAGNSGGQGPSNASNVSTPQQPTQGINVQKFAAGGLVTGPTMALMGEANNGAKEAALPLDNPQAIQPIVDALTERMGSIASGGDIHFHKGAGLISPDTLNKVMKQMSNRVKNNRSQFTASNSQRVTKRSA